MINKSPQFLKEFTVLLTTGKTVHIRAERMNYDADDDAILQNYLFFTKNELVCVLNSTFVISAFRSDAEGAQTNLEFLHEVNISESENKNEKTNIKIPGNPDSVGCPDCDDDDEEE
jgi:hypothetical protein